MSDQEVVEEGEGSTDSLFSHDDEGNCFTNLIRRDRCVQGSISNLSSDFNIHGVFIHHCGQSEFKLKSFS